MAFLVRQTDNRLKVFETDPDITDAQRMSDLYASDQSLMFYTIAAQGGGDFLLRRQTPVNIVTVPTVASAEFVNAN